MRFTKMHGIGNDFVMVSLFEERAPDPEALALAMSRPHYGVGADGLILIQPSEVADIGMRIFNADGSEAEMCGNGIRCAGKYVYDRGLCPGEEIRVETRAGIRAIRLSVESGRATAATVNMGEPRLRRWEIPMAGPDDPHVIDEDLLVDGRRLLVTCLSMGNPHCVIPARNLDETPWMEIGPQVERHHAFPERTNVHFVETIGPRELRIATWERGSGSTLACGTGASAACVAMNLLGRAERRVLAHLAGGDMEVDWSGEDNCVYITGPAEEVFTGDWPD